VFRFDDGDGKNAAVVAFAGMEGSQQGSNKALNRRLDGGSVKHQSL
jgi:hypothetical protein